jgi:hypothetical protein
MKQFEINGKTVLITDVTISGLNILSANILVDAPLDSDDLTLLKQSFHGQLDQGFQIELDVHYRL